MGAVLATEARRSRQAARWSPPSASVDAGRALRDRRAFSPPTARRRTRPRVAPLLLRVEGRPPGPVAAGAAG